MPPPAMTLSSAARAPAIGAAAIARPSVAAISDLSIVASLINSPLLFAGIFLLLQQLIAHLGQPFQLVLLFSEPVGRALFVRRAGEGCRLLGQLPDVVARNGDAIVELVHGQGTAATHDVSPIFIQRAYNALLPDPD